MPLTGGKVAGEIVSGIKAKLDAALKNAQADIADAALDLVKEVQEGGKAVKRALLNEAIEVRKQFSEIVGNATAEAEGALDDAKKEVAQAERPNGSGAA